jgi:hypothetical protein
MSFFSGRVPLLTVVLALAAISLQAQSTKSAAGCDRACLEGFVNQYLDAMIARNPYALPLAPKVKFSENEQAIPLGEGIWGTASGLGTYKLYVADPQAGEVGFLGTLRENDTPVGFALRLKIEHRLIREVESIVVRDPGAGKAVEALGRPDPAFIAPIPTSERRPRDEMIAIANKYADGIEHSDGKLIPFDAACNRLQNGIQTTNNPALLLDPKDTWTFASLGCTAQIDTKFFSFVRKIDPRRFPIVDEERGIVFSLLLFHIPGTVKSVDIPGHGTVAIPLPYQAPTTLDVAELYKIRSGKITKIEALQTNVPYGTGMTVPATAATAAARASADPCDRACLEAFVNQYLDALLTHDPSHLPVTANVKFTENDVVLKLGDGLWATASARGTYKEYFDDPEVGQVAFFGSMQENGHGIALALRLKIDGRRISEAESVVVRNPRTFELMEKAGAPDPVLLETIQESERLSRAQLTAIANQYFEAIEQGNGKVAPFAADCDRFENGMKTSGTLGCSAQLDTQVFNYISRIFPRRFLVVDPDRQVVFGFFMFNHRGDVLWVNSPGEGKHDMMGAAKRPFSVDVGEAFRIKNGQIRKVEALMTALPYGAKSPFVPAE